jgi:hypothetical protein
MKGSRGRINSCVALRGASRAASGILRFFSKTSLLARYKKADRLGAWPLVSADIQAFPSWRGRHFQCARAWNCDAIATRTP